MYTVVSRHGTMAIMVLNSHSLHSTRKKKEMKRDKDKDKNNMKEKKERKEKQRNLQYTNDRGEMRV